MAMDISVIVLTLNEELHVRRCIESVRHFVRDIFVVDCFSSDKTRDEVFQFKGADVLDVSDMGTKPDRLCDFRPHSDSNVEVDTGAAIIHFVQHEWPGTQAEQFNWALCNLPIRTRWILRLDADEYLLPELASELKAKLPGLPDGVSGVAFTLRRIFMGRHIRHGLPRIKLLRLFLFGKARCEQRLMDEHIELLEGRSVDFEGEFADHNLHDIGWWTVKHNGYALREAATLLDLKYDLSGWAQAKEGGMRPMRELEASRMSGEGRLSEQVAAKRVKKMKYARLPLFWRAFGYFCYRYVLRGGFLEGKEGFLWHFLQGWWYRTLVDTKVWEIERESGKDRDRMLVLLRTRFGLKL